MNAPGFQLLLPPQAIEAEQAVIGGCLVGGAVAWDRVADVVAIDDFYRDDHRRIMRHIERLASLGKEIDFMTVSQSVRDTNEYDQTGGDAYLSEIAGNTPGYSNIANYAKVVAEKALLRKLLVFSDAVQGLAMRAGNDSAQARIDEAEMLLTQLADGNAKGGELVPIRTALGDVIERIETRLALGNPNVISGLPTGLADVDELLDGRKDGDLIIVAGRPSMGKSALGLNVAEHVAFEKRLPVAVFSLEMSSQQLAARALASVGTVDNKRIQNGKLTDDDWDRMTVALGKMHEDHLFVDQSSGIPVAQIRARCRRMQRKHGLALVVIDYLQLIPGSGENRHQELSAITKALKAMAKDLAVPVIVLSQLSRKVEDRSDKRPMLSDLRESGAIEEDADVVMMMYRDDYYHRESAFTGMAEVLVRKNRMGACGDATVVFQKEYSRFRDAVPAEIARAKTESGRVRPRRGGVVD